MGANRVSRADFAAIKAKSKVRKAKREDNARFIESVSAAKGRIKRRMARAKKTATLSKLKKELWRETSLLVRSWSAICLACRVNPTQDACHIVPSNDGAITRYFLPNLYPGCKPCNTGESYKRGRWVYKHKDMFGDEFVDALYLMSRETFQLKKHWVIQEIERMKKLRNNGHVCASGLDGDGREAVCDCGH